MPHHSAVNLDSVENVSLGLFISRMGSLSITRMGEVCAAVEVAVDCG